MSRISHAILRLSVFLLTVLFAASGCDRDDEQTTEETADLQQSAEADEPEPEQAPTPKAPPTDELLADESDDDSDEPDFDAERADASDLQAVDTPKDAFELMQTHRLDDDVFGDVALWRLQMLRNAPFARAGYEFSTPWLDAYFWRQPEVYEPGDFDDSRMTELERHNARQIQKYEQRISHDELQRRWEELWGNYDADAPDDGWDVPGPWNAIEDRLEARILADELELPHPDDPMFDAEATRPIPRGFGGVRRGDDVPPDLDRPFKRRSIELPFLFDTPQIGVGEEEGRVRDVLVGSFYNPQQGDPAPPADQITGLEKQFIAAFGPPDETDYEAAWIGDAPLWRADDRVMMVGFRSAPEEAGAVVAIRSADPARPCGPEDGFDETVEKIAEATDNGDLDALLEHVSEPMVMQGVLINEDGEVPDDADSGSIYDAMTYNDYFDIDEMDGDRWREGTHGCAPLYGHHVLSGVGPLANVFNRDDDGKWKLVSIQEWVAASGPIERE